MSNDKPLVQTIHDFTNNVGSTVGNFVKSATRTLGGLGDRARYTLNDVVSNPNKYNVFDQAFSGNLTDVKMPSGRNLNDLPSFALNELTNNPEEYSIFDQAAEGNLTRSTLPQLQPVEQFVGEYGKNKLQAPAHGVAKGLYDTFRPDPTLDLKDRALSAANAGLNALSLTPTGLAYNMIVEPIVRTSLEGVRQVRTGDFDGQKIADRASGKSFTGLGDSLTDDPTLATALNLAEVGLSVIGPGGVKNVKNAPTKQSLVRNAGKIDDIAVPSLLNKGDEASLSKGKNPMTGEDVFYNKEQGKYQAEEVKRSKNTLSRMFDSIFQPSKNTPQDFQESLQEWRSAQLAGKQRANIVAEKFTGVADEDGFKVIQYIEEPNTNTASRVGLSNDQLKQYSPFMDNIRKHFDDVREEAVERGLDIKYLNNYISHVWSETPSQVEEKLRSLGKQPYFTKERTMPTYAEGIKAGLTPKYTNPAQLAAHYNEALDRATANKQFSDYLQKSGHLVPSSKAPLDWEPITAKLFPKATSKLDEATLKEEFYSAPKNMATVLNNVFDRSANEILDTAGEISGVHQNISLSGGIPGTPINAFTLGQTIKEFTTGKVRAPAVALFHSFTNSSADSYFYKNQSYIEDMAKQGINLNTTLNYADRFVNTLKNQLSGSVSEKGKAVIGKGYDLFGKYMDDPTFKRFMPILQVETYKQIHDRALRSGSSRDEATKLAGLTTRNFYGLVDEVVQGRNANVSAAMKTFLFAPKYREGMINVWKNSLRSLDPRSYGDRSLDLNRRFLLGTALTFGIWDYLNYKLNGRHLWENPAGQEITLLIPTNEDSAVGGKTLGIPILPSVAFLPRLAVSMMNKTIQGDISGAVGETTKLTSSILSPVGDVIRNEDYFGRPITKEDATPTERYGQIASYLVSRYLLTHPWLQAFSKAGNEGVTPIETVSAALELPIRFYNRNSIETRLFFEPYNKAKPYADQYKKLMMNDPQAGQAYYEKNKEKIDEFKFLSPGMKIYYDLKDQGKTEEAAKVLDMYATENKTTQQAQREEQGTRESTSSGVTAGGKFYYQNNDGFTKEFDLTPVDKADTTVAGLEASDQSYSDAIILMKESQIFKKNSTVTATKVKELLDEKGMDYTEVAYRTIKTLSPSSRAKYVNTVLVDTKDKNAAVLALIDNQVISSGVVDEMIMQDLISPAQGAAFKKAITARKNARIGKVGAAKKATLPKIKVNFTLKESNPVKLGSKYKLTALKLRKQMTPKLKK